jgi:hypothetical protein
MQYIILSFLFLVQNSPVAKGIWDTNIPESSIVLRYHVGIVQIALGVKRGNITFLDKLDFYSLGFPVGITLKTPGKIKFDLEFVPVLKPFINSGNPYSVLLLIYPSNLYALWEVWTFGFRLAFKTGEGQIGFTPLLNKGFKCSNSTSFFIELVAPARFGTYKASG